MGEWRLFGQEVAVSCSRDGILMQINRCSHLSTVSPRGGRGGPLKPHFKTILFTKQNDVHKNPHMHPQTPYNMLFY